MLIDDGQALVLIFALAAACYAIGVCTIWIFHRLVVSVVALLRSRRHPPRGPEGAPRGGHHTVTRGGPHGP